MGTSAVLKDNSLKLYDFPLVAKSRSGDLHVLFSSEKSGTVIASGNGMLLGESGKVWESCFQEQYWQILDSVTITFKS